MTREVKIDSKIHVTTEEIVTFVKLIVTCAWDEVRGIEECETVTSVEIEI